MVPCACGLMVPRMIIGRDAPAAMVPDSELPVHGLKVVPLSVEYCTYVILDGILSVSMTFQEEEKDLHFATAEVWVSSLPGSVTRLRFLSPRYLRMCL